MIDESFRSRFGVEVGDGLDLNGIAFRVAATTTGGNALTQHFAFLNWDDAAAVLASVSATSDVFLTPRPGVSPDELIAGLGDLGPRAEAIRSEVIAQTVADEVAEIGTPVLSVVVVLEASPARPSRSKRSSCSRPTSAGRT